MKLFLKPSWAEVILLIGLIGQIINLKNEKTSGMRIRHNFSKLMYTMVIFTINCFWAEILPLIGLIDQLTNQRKIGKFD